MGFIIFWSVAIIGLFFAIYIKRNHMVAESDRWSIEWHEGDLYITFKPQMKSRRILVDAVKCVTACKVAFVNHNAASSQGILFPSWDGRLERAIAHYWENPHGKEDKEIEPPPRRP